jgi:hypothetical protein
MTIGHTGVGSKWDMNPPKLIVHGIFGVTFGVIGTVGSCVASDGLRFGVGGECGVSRGRDCGCNLFSVLK